MNPSREDQWQILHDWAASFREKNNVTVKQFLMLIGLPCDDWYSIYLYPTHYQIDPQLNGIEEELFQGMTRAYKAFQPVGEEELAADRFAMQRNKYTEQGILDCFFDIDENGKLFAECYIDGPIPPEHNFVEFIQEIVKIKCDVKVLPTEMS